MKTGSRTIVLVACAVLAAHIAANEALASSLAPSDIDADAAVAGVRPPLIALNDEAAVEQSTGTQSDDEKAQLVAPPIVGRLPGRPSSYFLPGEFALRTSKGYYVTAINGGGRYVDPTIVTAATLAGPWEKFRISIPIPAPAYDKSFQTATGNWVTAVGNGGMTSNALHTDATQISGWEQFRMLDLSGSGAPMYYALGTSRGNFITAVGGGGHYDDAIHTDATQIGAWEEFKPVKCDDLGSGYTYFIVPSDGVPLVAPDGGGRDDSASLVHGITLGESSDLPWARFTLMAQADGTYALQTPNRMNYLTALNGGGVVQEFIDCDLNWFTGLFSPCLTDVGEIFHTDATYVSTWEKFRIVDEGDCKYTIQTASGYYMGLYTDSGGHVLFTTRRTSISNDEKFEFVMSTLASPPILH